MYAHRSSPLLPTPASLTLMSFFSQLWPLRLSSLARLHLCNQASAIRTTSSALLLPSSLSPLSKQKQSSTTATATTSSTNGKGQATVKLRLFPEGRWSRLEPYLTTTQDSPAQPRWHSQGLTMYLAAGPSSQSYKCQSSPTRTLIRVYQIIVLRASQTKHSYRCLLVPSAVP